MFCFCFPCFCSGVCGWGAGRDILYRFGSLYPLLVSAGRVDLYIWFGLGITFLILYSFDVFFNCFSTETVLQIYGGNAIAALYIN